MPPAIACAAGALIGALGVVLLTWGIRSLRRRLRNEADGSRTSGTVVENRAALDMENSTMYTPIVEFTTAEGRTLRVECLASSQIQHPAGAVVPVFYDPARPEQAGIVGGDRLGLFLLVGFGVAVTGMGLLMLLGGLIAAAL